MKDTQVVMADKETKKTAETDTGKEMTFQKSMTDGQTGRAVVSETQAEQVLTEKMKEKTVPTFSDDDTQVEMTGEEMSMTKKIDATKEQKVQMLSNM